MHIVILRNSINLITQRITYMGDTCFEKRKINILKIIFNEKKDISIEIYV